MERSAVATVFFMLVVACAPERDESAQGKTSRSEAPQPDSIARDEFRQRPLNSCGTTMFFACDLVDALQN